ncbi:MAG: hypothetical protein ACR2KJ_07285 [Jatrophihabitans sp.]
MVTSTAAGECRIRRHFATFLRASAQRRERLANRLDPLSTRVKPITG